MSSPFKSTRATPWTAERIAKLDSESLQRLAANAAALGETEIVALCEQALAARPKAPKRKGAAAAGKRAQRLISRSKAFQARGLHLPEAGSSWSGVRKSDGVVVMSLWARGVVSSDGICSDLLWAPNLDGTRPWSDLPAGRERLAHCKLLLEQGATAEGLLVHGEPLEGHDVEENASSVYGVNPEVVIRFRVEQRGAEYWAVWGAKTAPARL